MYIFCINARLNIKKYSYFEQSKMSSLFSNKGNNDAAEEDQPGSSNRENAEENFKTAEEDVFKTAEEEPNEPEQPASAKPSKSRSILSSIHKSTFTKENKKKFLKKLMEVAKDVLKDQLEDEQLKTATKFEIAVTVLHSKLSEAAEQIHKMN